MYYNKLLEAQYKALGLPNPAKSNRKMSDFEYLDFMVAMNSDEFRYNIQLNQDNESYIVMYTFDEREPIKLTFTQSQIRSMKNIASPNSKIENILNITDSIGMQALEENLQKR